MELRVNGQAITANLPLVVADSIQFVEMHFCFDGSWAGLTKVVQFTQGSKTYNVVLKNDWCHFPSEIVTGKVYVSVFGQKADGVTRATTAQITIPVRISGFVSEGDTPIPPTPDLYSQLLADIQKAQVDFGDGFTTDSLGRLIVQTTDKVEADNKLPVTSQGVYGIVGDIQKLIEEI